MSRNITTWFLGRSFATLDYQHAQGEEVCDIGIVTRMDDWDSIRTNGGAV